MGVCVILNKRGKDIERKRKKGKEWAYFVLGLYDNNDEGRAIMNERLQGDVSSYDYFEMQDDVSEFYHMATEYHKQNPVSGLRISDKGEFDSIGSIRDGESDAEDGRES